MQKHELQRIPVAGDIEVVEEGTIELADAQSFIGGDVEAIRVPYNGQLLCHEEGQKTGLPPNPRASAIALRPVVGNAIVLYGRSRWT
ncbi:MAG: DUF3846 domain-containing protein [Rhodocyclaceae bacterium]|nr:DUF3846 domain-containing protein [Rhodocyclaceae bacterium]